MTNQELIDLLGAAISKHWNNLYRYKPTGDVYRVLNLSWGCGDNLNKEILITYGVVVSNDEAFSKKHVSFTKTLKEFENDKFEKVYFFQREGTF